MNLREDKRGIDTWEERERENAIIIFEFQNKKKKQKNTYASICMFILKGLRKKPQHGGIWSLNEGNANGPWDQ